MNNNVQLFQLVLLILLVGAVIYLITNKGDRQFKKALDEINEMKKEVDSVQSDLNASIIKINESAKLVDSVLDKINDTKVSIEQVRNERNRMVKELDKELNENRIENDKIITDLKRLKPILVALRDKARLYTIRRNP